MSSNIKDLARKKLWALSAGRCAICKKELTGPDKLNIGQECHIVSSKPTGPRYTPDLSDYNDYDNFLIMFFQTLFDTLFMLFFYLFQLIY